MLRRIAPPAAIVSFLFVVLIANVAWGGGEVIQPLAPSPPPGKELRVMTPRVGATGPSASVFVVEEGFLAQAGTLFPPDPHGAVGPMGILEVANSQLRYRTRNGSLHWRRTQNTFTVCSGLGTTDPIDAKVIYDPEGGRFYYVSLEVFCDATYLNVVVSKTSDPASSDHCDDWYFYRYDVTQQFDGTSYGGDYPCIGIDHQALYVTLNMFALPVYTICPLPFDGRFRNCAILIFDKAALGAGTASSYARVNTPVGTGFSLQPASPVGQVGPGNVAYFADIANSSQFRVWALSDPLGVGRSLTSTLVDFPDNGGSADCAPQSGGPPLDPLTTFALNNSFWRDGSLWSCTTAGGLPRAVVYYYQVATNGFPNGACTPVESGYFDGGPGVWNFQPAIGGNAAGDVCLVFTQSSASTFPTMMATVRKHGTTGFPDPMTIAVSPSYYNGVLRSRTCGWTARWGDYGTACADPLDDSFWVCHELANGTTSTDLWKTMWANLAFPSEVTSWTLEGVPVRTGYGQVDVPRVVADGMGGTFIVWIDHRVVEAAIYVQRLSTDGSIASGWPAGGVRVPGDPIDIMMDFAVTGDGEHGIYVLGMGGFSTRLQRVTESGSIAPGWPPDGILLSSGGNSPRLVGDGTSGVVAAWSSGGPKVQKVDASGNPLWGPVSVSTSGTNADATSDGSGGCILAWSQGGIRAQRISASGSVQWAPGGVVVSSSGGQPRMVADGSGGAMIVFGRASDLYAVRIDSLGTLASGWPAGGAVVCAAANAQTEHRLVPDGTGGAVVTWTDTRSDESGDIFAVRLTGSGTLAHGWNSNGTVVCSTTDAQASPALVPDGLGGAFVAWEDGRGLHGLRLSAEGQRDEDFPENGSLLCTTLGSQSSPSLASPQAGTAIIVWLDGRNCYDGCPNAAYVQRQTFDAIGIAPDPVQGTPRGMELSAVRPTPSREFAMITFGVPLEASTSEYEISIFDAAGRRITEVEGGVAKPGYRTVRWDWRSSSGAPMAGGVYFVRFRLGDRFLQRKAIVLR